MTVVTKFDIKQRVYYMQNNKVVSGVISSISFATGMIRGRKWETSVKYYIGNSNAVSECLLFESKKELIKSL